MSVAEKTTVKRHKYQDLAVGLRAQIESGQLQPGDRLPSFFEMRTQFGATQKTTEKVHRLLEDKGLIVRQNGRGVFVAPTRDHGKTALLGFIGGGGDTSPYWAHLLRGVRQAAEQTGSQILMIDRALPSSIQNDLSGLLIATTGDLSHLELPASLPRVTLLYEGEQTTGAVAVADDAAGSALAVEHLLQLGHRKIAYLMPAEAPIVWHRVEGYRAALQKAGIVARPEWIKSFEAQSLHINGELSQLRPHFAAWFASEWRELGCTAMLVQSDSHAAVAIKALSDAGLRVPEDVSVIGFDGTEFCDYLTPHLTSIAVPLEAIGRRGVELLLQNQLHSRVVLPVRLRLGDSTACPRTAATRTASAKTPVFAGAL